MQLNPEYAALELFTKSQKLLDRFLFLLFAEDRYLLPPNSVRVILQDWRKLQELDEEIPLYNRFKKYFGYLNTGFKGQSHTIFKKIAQYSSCAIFLSELRNCAVI